MIYSIDSNKVITTIPYPRDYRTWRKNLADQDHKLIIEALTEKIGNTDIQTSSWIPGKNWANTVFAPIYAACNSNYEDAAKFFGLLVWETFMVHPEYWAFGRYKLREIPIQGLTYYKVHP